MIAKEKAVRATLPMIVQIRKCEPGDFHAVLPLLRQLYTGKQFDIGLLRSAYKRFLASDQQAFLCATHDRQVVGFGSVTIKSNLFWCETLIGYVSDMVVDEAHRGRGIGTRILDQLILWAKQRGCARIELNSGFERKEAQAFYERRGFKRGAYFYSKFCNDSAA